MNWDSVGDWLKENGGKSAALVGSLLTGNAPGAIAAGMSLVASATGTDDPSKALETLKMDPRSLVELKRIAMEEEKSIRNHIAEMKRLELEDKQNEHEQTQKTIRNGDEQESKIRWVRPIQASVSLLAGIVYVFYNDSPSDFVLMTLFALPSAYFGLREVGKGLTTWKQKLN